MKCNKCGSPIIPGEGTCRICGNKTDFSKREKQPEVIDFPEEIEEKVDVKEEIIDLPNFDDIIDVPKTDEVELTSEVVDFSNPIDETVNVSEPISAESFVREETIVPVEKAVEETIEEEKNEDVKKDLDTKVEEQKEIKKSSKGKTPAKVVEKEIAPKKVTNVKKQKKSSNSGAMVFLILVLIVSLAFNAYLFISGNEDKNIGIGNNQDTNKAYSKVIYDDYKLNVSSSWILEESENGLLIYDDTQNWAASLNFVDDANYEALTTNKDSLGELLNSFRYQFTSNYSKSVNDKEFHLFKGKYYEDYSVFVIVTAFDEDALIVVDLKFKGEVDDVLLNNILTMMTEVKENNYNELFKNNFDFVSIKDQIKSISKKIETSEE